MSSEKIPYQCQFTAHGWACTESASDARKLCYWHDPSVDKSGHDIKESLEAWAHSGKPMDGFRLQRTNLSGIDLVQHDKKNGFSMRGADLYRADLSGAHLFKIDLRGTSIMKANLHAANLHCALLQGCNVLGTDFSHARLEHVHWGKIFLQEERAKNEQANGNLTLAKSLWEETEEIARNIRKNCEKAGLFDISGYFFRKEMIMRRYQMPAKSGQRLISKLVDMFCGYGEVPSHVVLFSLALIFISAMAYFFLGVSQSGNMIGFFHSSKVGDSMMAFLDVLYFSVITFTTVGYGDITPVGMSKIVAAMEAFCGSFTMALFVVVFVKKMTR